MLDIVLGDAGHPDDAALRKAAGEQVKKIILAGSDAPAPSAGESIRSFVGEMTLQLSLVELRNQILAGVTSPQVATRKERGLRQWITAKLRNLDLAAYGKVTAVTCHQVAANLTRDALVLLAAR
ncbi:hypothetical protein CA951_31205 [Rhodococcus sp. NCIMB 12038]|nr:hypothetical protein CA951_31205 [Rhodococcus sp. NCIMB 12038]